MNHDCFENKHDLIISDDSGDFAKFNIYIYHYTCGFVEHLYFAFVALTQTSCRVIPLKYCNCTIPVLSIA